MMVALVPGQQGAWPELARITGLLLFTALFAGPRWRIAPRSVADNPSTVTKKRQIRAGLEFMSLVVIALVYPRLFSANLWVKAGLGDLLLWVVLCWFNRQSRK
ncbi:hypothetical protein [Levilactobacillus bambusae]|nr:hypothetical protein [Levilactobacillus bambusae]